MKLNRRKKKIEEKTAEVVEENLGEKIAEIPEVEGENLGEKISEKGDQPNL